VRVTAPSLSLQVVSISALVIVSVAPVVQAINSSFAKTSTRLPLITSVVTAIFYFGLKKFVFVLLFGGHSPR
jgi:hypothetical protein